MQKTKEHWGEIRKYCRRTAFTANMTPAAVQEERMVPECPKPKFSQAKRRVDFHGNPSKMDIGIETNAHLTP